jgi:hypothetical protein
MTSQTCSSAEEDRLCLVVGDPNGNQAASYTRFLLPFVCNLTQDKSETSPKSTFTYCALAADEKKTESSSSLDGARDRRSYLTKETSSILFDKAIWLKADPWDQCLMRKKTFVRGRPINIGMSPPRLVLFHQTRVKGKIEVRSSNPLQTGFLIIELFYPEGETVTLEDHLAVNELFKYCRQPYDDHSLPGNTYSRFIDHLWTAGSEHPKSLYEDRWRQWIDQALLKIDGQDYRLHLEDKPHNGWLPYADDRTFVWTCAIMPGGAGKLFRLFPEADRQAAKLGHWIKLLNVDGVGLTTRTTHQHSAFESEWAEERTYRRWQEVGTFYGFSYHSGAMIGPPMADPPLWRHFGMMYFDQLLLLFYLRVTLFRFSGMLCQISNNVTDTIRSKDIDHWMKNFQHLRGKFSIFTNLYQFPLISNQQQGLELYNIARRALDVQGLFEETQSKIHNSHDFFAQYINHRQSTTTTRLTVVATVGLIITFFLAILGIDGINDLTRSNLATSLHKSNIRWSIVRWAVLFLALSVFVQGLIILSSNWLNRGIESLANLFNKGRKE